MISTNCSTKVPSKITVPMKSNSDEVCNFSMKVVINKDKNKVLFAEVDSDFADVLLSFLTLPLGTIVRLVNEHFADQAPPTSIGSLNTLYQSLSNLETGYFCSDTGKQILVNARNSFAFLCKKLKVNLDDSKPTRYFCCGTVSSSSIVVNNDNFKDTVDLSMVYDREVILESSRILTASENDGGGGGGVFTNGTASFLVTDDLQIVPNSGMSGLQILKDFGIKDTDGLEETTFIAGFKEIMELLKCSLVSRTPLSDLILHKRQTISDTTILVPQLLNTEEGASSNKIILNAIVRKSTNKVLLVEADEDFVNFLFGLLVIPLGRVIHLLCMDTSLGSVDNLYRSVMNLDGGSHLKTEDLKWILLEPELPPEYLFKNQIFSHITEEMIPVMPYSVSKVQFVDENGKLGYIKGPASFMVTDDLVVAPFSAVSSLKFLHNLKVKVPDVEELKLEIGMKEAINILKASLTSTSALTDGLRPVLKKVVKQEKWYGLTTFTELHSLA